MKDKINTIFWYIKKGYFLQLLSVFQRSKNEDTRLEATQWCSENVVTEDEALKKLGINSKEDIEAVYLEYANAEYKKCDTQMGGAGSMVMLYNICKYFQPKSILETGVAYGWSTLSILSALENENAELVSIDMPYPKMGNESNVGCVVHPFLRNRWTLIRKPDILGVPIALRKLGKIDLCHYDSDKSYRGRKWAHMKLWESLNVNGIYIEDDINDNIAFQEFSIELGIKPIIVKCKDKFLGIIVNS